jgi:hypothetical protein
MHQKLFEKEPKMKTNAEKRAYERHSYTAPIVFSYFNKEHCFKAQTLNHCAGGMCFKSNFFLRLGTTVYIRVKKFHPNNSCIGLCHGLRSVTLAEVKWCDEELETDVFSYSAGVKYYEPDY